MEKRNRKTFPEAETIEIYGRGSKGLFKGNKRKKNYRKRKIRLHNINTGNQIKAGFINIYCCGEDEKRKKMTKCGKNNEKQPLQ